MRRSTARLIVFRVGTDPIQFVNTTVALYPNPQGDLRAAINVNLDNFFAVPSLLGCKQIFPFP